MTFILTPSKPPYYETKTTAGDGVQNRVNTQTTPTESTGTTPISGAEYTIPKNTMVINGDTLIKRYWGNTYNGAGGSNITVNILGQSIGLITSNGDRAWTIEIQILRTSNNTMAYTITYITESTVVDTKQGTATVDWTIDNNTELEISIATTGNIRITAGYDTLIKL